MNNGNLIFASANQATMLQSEINQLETSLQTLQNDLDSLRGRVDNLEALGDRVEVLETSMDTFQEDLNTTTSLVEDLDQRVVGIETDITQVKGSVERFQVFFEGLRELLVNTFTSEETEQ
jgi:predicted  nucleic acid-binding Zn-ribbon protein